MVKPTAYPLCSGGDLRPLASTGGLSDMLQSAEGSLPAMCVLGSVVSRQDVSHVFILVPHSDEL